MAHPRRGVRVALIAASAVVVAVLAAAWMLRPAEQPAASPSSTATPRQTLTPTPSVTPSPTRTPAGYAANTAEYEGATLPAITVFAVNPALEVDDDPYGAFTGTVVTPREESAPVFADPEGEPVGALLREYVHGGNTVPVIERQTHWVRVLLPGRKAVPSKGDPSQVTGWLRVADVEFGTIDPVVEVSISKRTIDIVRSGDRDRIADDFGWGTDQTPTPVGRTFIMKAAVVPQYSYTRGHPIVYLGVQSPTLDGFGGASVAVTAFHYHDARSGNISNGCLRVDVDAITALAKLPLGTPVIIRD
ncbi:L,D-transpeptidase [Microbacterium terricola]|uniref:L,D-TPase catalytic domain-containing protein n=1 Tax=Microbacterium terricola TaxID=344163 RepID=A0ABM8DXL7_9MICO|nr:L,D-transpeptidase family protein [Microbacterium terricola]UYK38955.1 murein L,D-transpeptidase [Microbacterium terricola]BDV30345.1 hypothetical protein Microterr_10050 [Microbacterium terricola]